MIKLMGMECISIQMDHSTKEIGLMINNMDMAWKHGQTDQNMKENLLMEKNKGKEK